MARQPRSDGPTSNLEVDETLVRNFAAWNELDAIMRLRCHDFPDKLAKWEEEVMKPMRKNEQYSRPAARQRKNDRKTEIVRAQNT
jgi:hypothetical protein